MEYKKVKSIEHLKELLAQEMNHFVIGLCGGALRSSKFIKNLSDMSGIYVMHECDGSEETYPWEGIEQSYIGRRIEQGWLYAELD